jgi:hypothetical protein
MWLKWAVLTGVTEVSSYLFQCTYSRRDFEFIRSIMSPLYSLWQSYTAASARSAANDMGLPPPPNAVSVGIDSARWLKLCKDSKLLDKKFRPVDVDLIFTRNAVQRRLEFFGFQDALVEVAVKKGVNGEALVERLLTMTANGPSIRGTFAGSVRLHDDKSTYTGVYKAGGPTTTDYEKMGMGSLCDRSKKATVRGVPAIAVQGPGGVNALVADELPVSPYIDTPTEKVKEQITSHILNTSQHGQHKLKTSAVTASGIGEEKEVDDLLDESRLPPISLKQLRQVYIMYTDASNRSNAKLQNESAYVAPPPNPVAQGIDSARFLKLCKDGKVLDKNFRLFDLDIVFQKNSKKRRMGFKGLQKAFLEISLKKNSDVIKVIDKLFINTSDGPSIRGTFADDHVRLHDDKSTYTGVYKAGGPTNVDYGNMGFNQLVNRSNKGTVRGVPTWVANGPGDKFAASNAHNDALKQSQKYYSRKSRSHGFSTPLEGEDAPPPPPLSREDKAKSVLGKFSVSRKVGRALIRGEKMSTDDGAGESTDQVSSGARFATGDSTGSPLSASDLQAAPPLSEADMEVTPEQDATLKAVYAQYELHSRSYKEQKEIKSNLDAEVDVFYGHNCGVDGSKFLKLCNDAHLIDRQFKKSEVDLVFSKHRPNGGNVHSSKAFNRKLNFEAFLGALAEVAVRKGLPMRKLVKQLEKYDIARVGPSNTASSTAEYNRFYDDQSTYTGQYKQGGPDLRQAGDYLDTFRKEGSPTAHHPQLGHYASSLEAGGQAHRSIELDLGAEGEGADGEDDIDMSITQLQLEELGLVYDSYEKASSGKDEGIDSARFLKLCKDVNLLDDLFTRADVDIMFTRHKVGARKIDFEHFQDALLDIAKKKGMPLGTIVDSIDYHASMGISFDSGTTTAQANRLYDDKTTFTGQYKQGGPDLNQNKDYLATFREGVEPTKLKLT